jgi:hypothetical protein
MTRSGISLVIAALLVLQVPAARAAQLDKDSCAKLKTEQTQLEQDGTRGSMGKGPEWAKANLSPEKLQQIRRLIELDEQLLFRCGGKPLVVIPHDPDPAAREVESKDGAAKAPPAKAAKAPPAEKKQAVPVKKAAAPPADQPAKGAAKEPVKAQPAVAPAAAKEGEEKKAAAPAADQGAKEAAPQPQTGPAPTKEAEDKKAAALKAAKAKAKKKANDAYSPGPTDWFTNPFAGQAPPAKK